ncbi:chromatin binding protein [Coelomomyces lativittatus]|nr:chromatin binding protein [Coelomomyces lativittatus]
MGEYSYPRNPGSVKGHWWVFLFPSLQEGSFKDHFHASIRHFALSKSGHSLAITLADKTVQVYALPYDPQHPFECVPILKCHDPVNRQAWSSCAWSANETYLIGATIGHTHVFHVWRKESGTLVTLLEGPAEPILHFAVRCSIEKEKAMN